MSDEDLILPSLRKPTEYQAALANAVQRDIIDNGPGEIAVVASQDTSTILDANKSEHLYGDGYTPSRDLRHVARIPLIVAEMWLNQYGVDVLNQDHKAAVIRLLNSNEWSYLRTGGGRI